MGNFKKFVNFIFILQVLLLSAVSGFPRRLYLTGIPQDSNDQPILCNNSECRPGEMCELRTFQVMCFTAPCPQPDPIPTCIRLIYPLPEEVELDGQGSEAQQEEGVPPPEHEDVVTESGQDGNLNSHQDVETDESATPQLGQKACPEDQNPEHGEVQSGLEPGEELETTQQLKEDLETTQQLKEDLETTPQPGEDQSVQPSEQLEDFTYQPEEPVEPGQEYDHLPEEEDESEYQPGEGATTHFPAGEEPGSELGYNPTMPPLFEPGSGWEDGGYSEPSSR